MISVVNNSGSMVVLVMIEVCLVLFLCCNISYGNVIIEMLLFVVVISVVNRIRNVGLWLLFFMNIVVEFSVKLVWGLLNFCVVVVWM